MKKKNIKDVEKIYSNYGLKIIGNYEGVDNRLDAIDKEGYKYCVSITHLLKRKNKDMKSGRYNDKNVFKEYNIKHYIEINNISSTIKTIPKKIDTEEMVFCCGECGREYSQKWKNFMSTSYKVCPSCLKKVKKSKKKDIIYIKNIFEKAGYKYIDENIKTFGMHYAYYVQDIEGYKGRMLPYSAKKNNSKIEKFHSKNKYSIENINLYCLKNNMYVECLSDTFFTKKKLLFKCSCGNLFYALWDNVKKGKYRCNFCSKVISNNEQKVIDYLDFIGANYVSQYNVKNIKNYKNLYFDFYLEKYNLFIEIDGEQHYRPVFFGGISKEEAISNYNKQVERDNAKNEYCKNRKSNILRISYKDIKNNEYKKIISAKIDDLSK